ncbi:unnamed protein product [Owenia fusiformis]|uniref:Uncharacterized protein n=1 Tax=Owenia fusiformis TaxID=6347 RepID=A0A8J1T4Y4_OWEFU|nr:unnamed protein product [Owenia fusiformis]
MMQTLVLVVGYETLCDEVIVDGYDIEVPAVMATSYALMCYVHNNYIDEASKIMYWIQHRRKTLGGWASTMDTITAIQALHNYGLTNPNRDIYYMEVEVTATSTPGWKEVVVLDRTNFNVAQEIEIPNVYGSIKITARGNGLALIQVETEVNVEFQDLMEPGADLPEDQDFDSHFDLEISLDWAGRNFSTMYITTCTRWVRTDLSPHSQLAFIDLEIPSGYYIIKEELRKQQKKYPFIKRSKYSAESRMLSIYFEKIGTDWICPKIRADRWYPVANISIQNFAIVGEYYEPEIQNATLYTVYNLNFLHVCQVCGSFECPYCPHYNTGTPTNTWNVHSCFLYIFGTTVALFIRMNNMFLDFR